MWKYMASCTIGSKTLSSNEIQMFLTAGNYNWWSKASIALLCAPYCYFVSQHTLAFVLPFSNTIVAVL